MVRNTRQRRGIRRWPKLGLACSLAAAALLSPLWLGPSPGRLDATETSVITPSPSPAHVAPLARSNVEPITPFSDARLPSSHTIWPRSPAEAKLDNAAVVPRTQRVARIETPPRAGQLMTSPPLAVRSATHTLERLLNNSPHLRAVTPITVVLEGNDAVLRGTVASQEHRDLAARLALLEVGVRSIRNELLVAPAAGEFAASLETGQNPIPPNPLTFITAAPGPVRAPTMEGLGSPLAEEFDAFAEEPSQPLEPSFETLRLLEPAGYPAPPLSPYPSLAVRFGWWATSAAGSPTQVGQYQELDSAPFFDVDGLRSNGVRTLDLTITGLDDQTYASTGFLFGPSVTAEWDYQRYIHRLDHDPLTNMPAVGSGAEIVSEDLNVGDNYAIRVEQAKTKFEGGLTKNIKYAVKFNYLRKHGARQAIAMQHGSGQLPAVDCTTCHLRSQTQQIDWTTARVEPVLEGTFGRVNIQYSRPMRFFSQNDQVVTSLFGLHDVAERAYGAVPNNVTQIDRVKLSADLGPATQLYASTHYGDTKNQFRDTHRRFRGLDLRVTNRTWRNWTLGGYARVQQQQNEYPPFLLAQEKAALSVNTSVVPPYGLQRPINYDRTAVGTDISWRPRGWHSWADGFTLRANAEYSSLERDFANASLDNEIQLAQEQMAYSKFLISATKKWTPSFSTFARYSRRDLTDPLFPAYRGDIDYVNTSIPEQEDLVEVGGTWTPSPRFVASATWWIENRHQGSLVTTFDEDNYPFTLTAVYVPSPRWSWSCGYGEYTNWIDQEIMFPSDTPLVEPIDRRFWSYSGRSRVLSAAVIHQLTETLRVTAGCDYIEGRNTFDPLEPWPDLPAYSAVIVDRTRLTGGVDWQCFADGDVYFRYLFEDFDDSTSGVESGSASMFISGISLYR